VSDRQFLDNGRWDFENGFVLELVKVPPNSRGLVKMKFTDNGDYYFAEMYLIETILDLKRRIAELFRLQFDHILISEPLGLPTRDVFEDQVVIWDLDLDITYSVTTTLEPVLSSECKVLAEFVEVPLSAEEVKQAKAIVVEAEIEVVKPVVEENLVRWVRQGDPVDMETKLAQLVEMGVDAEIGAKTLRVSKYSVKFALERLFPFDVMIKRR
jgi:hypothetical protein